MRLDDIAVTLRPRNVWEAIDLGYAMVQTWAKPVFMAWFAVYLPAVLLVSLLCWSWPTLAALILWWLKPAFERVVLYVLSNATFGKVPTLKETMRALPSLWWNRGLLAALTYQRLLCFVFLSRSFHLPVTQLEMGRGKSARLRRQVLAREGGGAAIMLTVVCAHLELILMLSLYAILYLFMPADAEMRFSWSMLFDPDTERTTQYLSNLVGTIAVSIVEPFYVAGGFALYLHSRTLLEGWDVELAFKRMAERVAALRTRMAAALSLVLVVLCLSGTSNEGYAQTGNAPADAPAVVQADDADPDAETDEQEMTDAAVSSAVPHRGAREAAERVMDAPEFGRYKDDWKIEYVGPTWEPKEKPKSQNWKWLAAIGRFIAEISRFLAWLGLAILVGLVVYLIARHIGLQGWGGKGATRFPDVLFGLDIRPESLPDDVPMAARALLARGDLRGAVGLLYRGALVALMQDGRIEIARGDTEGECVATVKRTYRDSTEEAHKAVFFAELVTLWQRVAYGAIPVPAQEVESLIDTWSQHFSLRRNNAAATAPQTVTQAA